MGSRVRIAALLGVFLLAATAAPVLAAAPANDDISSPIAVGALPYSNAQDTSEATSGATDPDCAGGAATVWYAFTPADSGWYQLDTIGSDYDTTLAIGVADGSGGIDMLACNDDSVDLQSRLVLDLIAGETYLVVIGSFGGGSGANLMFNVDATTEPVILDLSVTVDSTGRFLRTGQARIHGTVTCNVEAYGYLEARVTQQVGRFTVTGFGSTEFTCSTEGGTWQLDVSGYGARFAGGNASVELYAEAYDFVGGSWDSEYVGATIRLMR